MEIKRQSKQQLDKDYELEMLELLVKVISYATLDYRCHMERVAAYAQVIGKAVGFTTSQQELLYHASKLHDIGKVVGRKQQIVQSTQIDEDKCEEHPEEGYNLLKKYHNKYLQLASIIALTHHEHYDGTGYPLGLRAKEIAVEGRIVALANTFVHLLARQMPDQDCMVEAAFNDLIPLRNTYYDGELIDALIQHYDEVRRIHALFEAGGK